MPTYTLFCRLEDDPNGSPFSVKIDPNDPISELKELIKSKKPNNLRDVDADELVLWKVSPKKPIQNEATQSRAYQC